MVADMPMAQEKGTIAIGQIIIGRIIKQDQGIMHTTMGIEIMIGITIISAIAIMIETETAIETILEIGKMVME
jgi:hypothetical protein